VNGRANLAFRNEHEFDVLKAVDVSKKDLAAKRWMSCLVVSNGFRFQDSTVQLTNEDRETLQREQAFFGSRSIAVTHPPFYVPDHLAPRCNSCKMLFSVTVRRYHCRSCGLVHCGNCFKWRGTIMVPIDQRTSGQSVSTGSGKAGPLNETRLTAAVELSLRDRGNAPRSPPGQSSAQASPPGRSEDEENAGAKTSATTEDLQAATSQDEAAAAASAARREALVGGFNRERGGGSVPVSSQSGDAHIIRLCAPCSGFFEAGVGETYALQRKFGLASDGATML